MIHATELRHAIISHIVTYGMVHVSCNECRHVSLPKIDKIMKLNCLCRGECWSG